MTNTKKIILYFLLSFFLVACDKLSWLSSKPSDSDIQNIIIHNLQSDKVENIFLIKNFQRVNGFEKGDKKYVVSVKYELVMNQKGREKFMETIKSKDNSMFSMLFFSDSNVLGKNAYGEIVSNFVSFAMMHEKGKNINAEDFENIFSLQKQEQVVFIKTENGWQVEYESD